MTSTNLALALAISIAAPLTSFAANSSGFICRGSSLYGGASSISVALLESPERCRAVVMGAREGFTCAGAKLVAAGAGNNLPTFSTEENCKRAIASARSGFLCSGQHLYRVGARTSSAFENEAHCQSAVARAREGFTCNGSKLISNASSAALTTFESEEQCLNSVRGSNSGTRQVSCPAGEAPAGDTAISSAI